MEDNFFEMPIDMNKSLAEIMDSTDKSRIFLTSDWHIMKYKYQKGRNYVNTNEIVKWCKDNIKSNDIFMYLGDLCYRYANKEDSKKAQEIYKSLPGIKVLILGNHDIHQGEDFYNNCGFDYVFTEFEYHDIVFTHRPINMIMRGNLSGLNIHGHIHELTNDYDFLDPSRNINVYPNNYDNKPTTLKYILNHINKLTKDNKPNNTTDLSDGLTESSRIIRDYLGSQLDDSNIINENYIISKNDLYINFDKFESGKSNVLLVTGFSGSGKSTLASQLAKKYKCEHYELDLLSFYFEGKFWGNNVDLDDLRMYEPGLAKFINTNNLVYGEVPDTKTQRQLFEKYIRFLIKYCKGQKDKRFIIEGVQLYEIFDKDKPQTTIYNNPLIIKGTSALKSALQAANRNSKDADRSFLKEFPALLKWLLKDNNKLNKLIKSLN